MKRVEYKQKSGTAQATARVEQSIEKMNQLVANKVTLEMLLKSSGDLVKSLDALKPELEKDGAAANETKDGLRWNLFQERAKVLRDLATKAENFVAEAGIIKVAGVGNLESTVKSSTEDILSKSREIMRSLGSM